MTLKEGKKHSVSSIYASVDVRPRSTHDIKRQNIAGLLVNPCPRRVIRNCPFLVLNAVLSLSGGSKLTWKEGIAYVTHAKKCGTLWRLNGVFYTWKRKLISSCDRIQPAEINRDTWFDWVALFIFSGHYQVGRPRAATIFNYASLLHIFNGRINFVEMCSAIGGWKPVLILAVNPTAQPASYSERENIVVTLNWGNSLLQLIFSKRMWQLYQSPVAHMKNRHHFH